jgi:hypothetical protein
MNKLNLGRTVFFKPFIILCIKFKLFYVGKSSFRNEKLGDPQVRVQNIVLTIREYKY